MSFSDDEEGLEHLQAPGVIMNDMDKENDPYIANTCQSPYEVVISTTSPTKCPKMNLNVRNNYHKKSLSTSHLVLPQWGREERPQSAGPARNRRSKGKQNKKHNRRLSYSKSPIKRNKKNNEKLKSLRDENIRLKAENNGYQSRLNDMENKAYELEEIMNTKMQTRSVSDNECNVKGKPRKKERRRKKQCRSHSCQITIEQLKEELEETKNKTFDLGLLQQSHQREKETKEKYEKIIKRMREDNNCDKCVEIKKQNHQLNTQLKENNDKINELQEENKDMYQCMEDIEILRTGKLDMAVQCAGYKQQITELSSKYNELEEQNKLLINEAEEHQTIKTEYVTEIKRLQTKKNEIKERMGDLETKYNDKCDESDRVRDENNDLVQKLNAFSENKNKYKKQKEEMKIILDEVKQLENEMEEIVSENIALKSDMNTLSEKYETLVQTFNDIKDSEVQSETPTNETNNNEMEKFEEEIMSLKTEKETIEREHDEMRLDVIKLKSEYKILQVQKKEMVLSKDNEIMGLQTNLKSMERMNNELKRGNENRNDNTQYEKIIKLLQDKLNKERDDAEKFIQKYHENTETQAKIRNDLLEEIKEQRKSRESFKKENERLYARIYLLENKQIAKFKNMRNEFIAKFDKERKNIQKITSMYSQAVENKNDQIERLQKEIKKLKR